MSANDANDGGTPPAKPFPTLPIITLDPPQPTGPRLTQQQKYGGLFWLGIVGLVVVVALVGWFGWNVYAMRDVWNNVYVLHETSKPEDERIQAAFSLSRDVRVNAQQRWDIALRKPLPPLARYVIAESWSAEIPDADPSLYAKMIAYSEGWPGWLRLLGVRLMAVAASEGLEFPSAVLDDLAKDSNPDIGLLADFVRVSAHNGDDDALKRLRAEAASNSARADLARELIGALDPATAVRKEHLKRVTEWLWNHDTEAMLVTRGWTTANGRLERTQP